MALPLIGGLLSAVGDIAGSWVKGKMEEKKALTSIKVARAKAEATVYEKQATGELDMEKSLTDQMEDPGKMRHGRYSLLQYWQDAFFHGHRKQLNKDLFF